MSTTIVRTDKKETVSTAVAASYSWNGSTLAVEHDAPHVVGVLNGQERRMYVEVAVPARKDSARIHRALLKLTQTGSADLCSDEEGLLANRLCLHKVNGELSENAVPPSHEEGMADFEAASSAAGRVYCFDITRYLDTEESSVAFAVMLSGVEGVFGYAELCRKGEAEQPVLEVEYLLSDITAPMTSGPVHSTGFVNAKADLATGSLYMDFEDLNWAGARMPFSLKHEFHSALRSLCYGESSSLVRVADFSQMQVGLGWRLSVMQGVRSCSFRHEDTNFIGYAFTDETGAVCYLKEGTECVCPKCSTSCYYLYEATDGSNRKYDPVKRELYDGGSTLFFDASGRWIRQQDEHGNVLTLNYTSNRLTSVTDGAGRSFTFSYTTDGFLSEIIAPDNSKLSYGYTNERLTCVTRDDQSKAVFSYDDQGFPASVGFFDAEGEELVRNIFSFEGSKLKTVTEQAAEEGSLQIQKSCTYSVLFGARKSKVEVTTEDESEETVYLFDDTGAVSNSYSCVNNQDFHALKDGEQRVANTNNLLRNHSFATTEAWTLTDASNAAVTWSNAVPHPLYGKNGARVKSTSSFVTGCGIEQATDLLPKGEYTFSAYVKGHNAYLRVTDGAGTVLAQSETINGDKEWVRLFCTVNAESEWGTSVKVQLLTDGEGIACFHAPQLERGSSVNRYNLLEEGGFEYKGNSKWSLENGAILPSDNAFEMNHVLQLECSDVGYSTKATQDVLVKTSRETRETFTLSGWAKAMALPQRERNGGLLPKFTLRATVHYNDSFFEDTASESFTADFSPSTDEWQYVSLEFSKSKYRTVEKVTVCLDYSHNSSVALFDNISLTRSSVETGLMEKDFLPERELPVEEEEEELVDTEDSPVFEEYVDANGNTITETTFRDGEFGTVYRSFGYSANGNDIIKETDARGNTTLYTVDPLTSRNSEVTDRLGNKTAYEYDKAGKTTKVTSKKADGTGLAHVSYAYDAFDQMKEIHRGDGLKYVIAYDTQRQLKSVGIQGKAENLVHYSYTGGGRIKTLSYANGHRMEASYNAYGEMIAEKWYDAADTLIAHYRYAYDGNQNVVRSVDILGLAEYNYMYEDGRLAKASQSTIAVSGELVTGKSLVCSILYVYDSEGNLEKKRIVDADGTERVIFTETPEEGNPVVKFTAGQAEITSHSRTDGFGRKDFDELQLGTGFVSRKYEYHTGAVSEEHKTHGKLKSTPVTHLVSHITLSDGRTLDYEYDAEERITKVTDSVERVTEYTYDALGQLKTETVNDTVVNEMLYDNYGNIKAKNGVAYTYGDSSWKDLLTQVGTQSITYDAQGNPVSYLGHTLTWEKGRQLKSFDGNSYTYNANGIRTSKTVGGVKHSYLLDGTKILKETWVDNVLVPLYDNEDAVCGIELNGEAFFFLKNLQGDVIAITDKDGEPVARYSYDAWGKLTGITDPDGTAITDASHIAIINPYRYRGYYYDTEIGMYYLQSRYYDAQVGRFVNADGQLKVRKGPETNLFAYVLNSPIIYADYLGRDAVLLIQSNGAYGMGHAAIIVEDRFHFWYYFSVGGKGENSKMIIDFVYLGKKLNIKTITQANSVLNAFNRKIGIYNRYYCPKRKGLYIAGVYTSMHYFTGNFHNSYEWCKALNSNPGEYHFYFNSCMTASSYALSLGVCTGEMASEYQVMLSKMTRMKIPNQVDNAINHFKHYYELTGFRRLIANRPYYLFDSSFLWGFY